MVCLRRHPVGALTATAAIRAADWTQSCSTPSARSCTSSRRRRCCADELRERLGLEVSLATAEAAIKAEIAYYRAHLHEGRDRRIARRAAPRGGRRDAAGAGDRGRPHRARCSASLRFHAYPDAAPALRALRARGLALVVVSNWDHSLHERLEETGLAPLVDGAVASAELGHAKPARDDLRARARARGRRRRRALHAGDSARGGRRGRARGGPAGRAGGARRGTAGRLAGVPSIRTLAELPPLCEYARSGP